MSKKDTLLSHAGLDPHRNHGVVNPPVYHASTIVFPTLEAYEQAEKTPFEGTRYGRRGTPTTFALEEAIADLEGGYRSIAVPSGLSAITTTLLGFLKTGDHLLMVDTAYYPTRRFCDTVLAGFGIETTYYDPLARIDPLLQPNTKLIFLESPGSLTFEVQDVPAIAAAARARGIVTAIDNTWSAGLLFTPLQHGIDISIQAATKYIVGHSDAMLGLIVCNEATYLRVKRASAFLGTAAAPDDCYLALRGFRTLKARLERHEQTTRRVAQWLAEQDAVEHVRHPMFASCPGHAFWKRDFSGANGLVSFVLKAVPKQSIAAFVDGLRYFSLGASWGGFESLIIPFDVQSSRTATGWLYSGPCFRLHCGLEDPDDLISDLSDGFERLRHV
ncbi:MAG: cystathionine beta-lyase [Hyphomicrobiales bacterium]|nr:cystathionine beta-lyase [Hyphomicrobiales bacterium]